MKKTTKMETICEIEDPDCIFTISKDVELDMWGLSLRKKSEEITWDDMVLNPDGWDHFLQIIKTIKIALDNTEKDEGTYNIIAEGSVHCSCCVECSLIRFEAYSDHTILIRTYVSSSAPFAPECLDMTEEQFYELWRILNGKEN